MKTNLIAPNRRILLVDDSDAIHQDFRKILSPEASGKAALASAAAALFGQATTPRSSTGFETESAYQGEQALAMVRQAVAAGNPYSMAFVDVRMPPGWDGIETIGHIWKEYPDLQVVICTAYSDYSLDEIIRKLGETDRLVILKKPFDTIEVIQIAHALTEKWRLLQHAKTRIESLEIAASAREAALFRSEERFRLIAENAADLIAVLDLNGTTTYRSPSFEKVLGIPLEVLAQTPLSAQFHPDDLGRVESAIREMISTGLGQVLEFRMQHCDGSWRAFESHGNPVHNVRGEVERLVMVSRDITLRQKQDEARRQMEVQLRHAQKMESIGQLAAGIAHEINTPTQYIGDNTHFVQDGFRDLAKVLDAHRDLLVATKAGAVTPEIVGRVDEAFLEADAEYLLVEIPKAIDQSLQGLQRVSKIVGAMKDFSHPGTNEKTAVDLNRAIESTLTVATNEWKYVANIVTNFVDLPPVPCLPGELNQVILNIVVNASHSIADVIGDGSGGKGTIIVSTALDGEWVEIRISDTGTGIREEIRRKIFDPFFTTKGVGKGTGQGLAIAHSVVVDKHGGEIRLESEVGYGSTFIIRLPLCVASSERRAA